MAPINKLVSGNDKTSEVMLVINAAQAFPQTHRMLIPIIHSAVAFVYSALALAETFVLFAAVIGLFALVVRAIVRAFRKD